MGFWSNLFSFGRKKNLTYAQSLQGGIPIYSSFGREIYRSDAVKTAIGCIAREMKKLTPQHVRETPGGRDSKDIFDSSVQRVLEDPNPLQTTGDFLEKVIWLLFKSYNAFIMPTWADQKTKDGVRRRYTGLYPIVPISTEFEEDSSGELYIKFKFANNFETTLLYSDVIHIRYQYSSNDFMGGDAFGHPDHEDLKDTLDINKQILSGLASMMQTGGNINGIVKTNSILNKEKAQIAVMEFNELLKKNASGFLPLGMESEYIPVKREVRFIDAETVKFIDQKILRYFGVSLAVLNADYTPQQFEAFYSSTLEPLIKAFSQAFTKRLFTATERSHGNKVIFYPAEMVFMTASEKLEMVRLLGDSGSLFENEKRRAFGLTALPELEGVRMMSLNYVDSSIAKDVQMSGGVTGDRNQAI